MTYKNYFCKSIVKYNMRIRAAIALSLSLLAGCAGQKETGNADDITTYSSLLGITQQNDDTTAVVANPWKSGSTLRTYHLSSVKPSGFSYSEPDCTVRIPLRRVVVMTNSIARLLSETGLAGSIAGVCEPEYIKDPLINALLTDGSIQNCGNSMHPDIERIISLSPDAIFVSPFQESGYGQLERLGIPLIECADYMETSPLGRAEWMRFYGRLFGKGLVADSLFRDICGKYDELREMAATCSSRPTVMLDTRGGSAWYVAGGGSTIGRMIADAGGRYLFDGNHQSGSVPLSFESVYEKAADADVWLLKNSSTSSKLTYRLLKEDFSSYARFRPFRERNIWVCDVYDTPYFEVSSFHPELLLQDFVSILHPECSLDKTFYHPLAE